MDWADGFLPGKYKGYLMGLLIKRLLSEESGATVVEYAILLAAIAMAVIITVGVLGQKLDSSFQKMVTLMS
jgi:pilus assembly protein Flp/PilA